MIGEADFSMTQMAYNALDDRPINPEDYAGLLVRFCLHPHQNMKKSEEEGRPIFEEIEYVDIRTPGDRGSHQFRPVSEIDKQRWPKHYEAFKARSTEPVEGTPLEHWPVLSRAQVEELKFFNIYTVEQLANLADVHAQNYMGMNTLKTRAQAFLAQTEGAAEAEKLANELKARDDRIADLEARLESLMERMESEEA